MRDSALNHQRREITTMSDKELKSRKFAEKLNLKDKLSIDDKTLTITPNEGFYESTLEDIGVTLEQVKKLQKHDANLFSATALVGGEMAAEHFKEHPESGEVALSYSAGHNTYESFYGYGENTTPFRAVVSVHGASDHKGELKKVGKEIASMFDDINS